MQEPLRSLVELARLDERLQMVERDGTAIQIDVRRQEETVGQLKARLTGAKEETVELRRQADSRELKIRSLEDELKRFQVQLNTVRTQRELDALKSEIESRVRAIGELEDQELEELTKIDEVKAAIADLERQVNEEEARLATIRQEVSEASARYEEELGELRAQRDVVRGRLDPQILGHYERLCASRTNALVPVRERVCQGCHTLVPLQIWSEVMRQDRIVYCHSCARMLYFDDSQG